jgi:hypothetical protein
MRIADALVLEPASKAQVRQGEMPVGVARWSCDTCKLQIWFVPRLDSGI